MAITFFRQRRPGPEMSVENAVACQIPNLFRSDEYPLWAAGSPAIGAGRPDLVVVSCEPAVYALANVEMPTAQILAYLRAVGRARPKTISERIGKPVEVIIKHLEGLQEADVVSVSADVYMLCPSWRNILPEIVTIEVKVSDWRKALSQAARNRIFAHRSFIALPADVANRIRKQPVLGKLGIGVLAVGEQDEVKITREARRRKPRVWTYYYQLAHIVATHFTGASDAVCRVA